MTKVSLWIALALPLVCMAPLGASQGAVNSTDEDAIKSVIVQMTEGFNRHDAEASIRMYQPDADFVSVRGEMGLGRDAAEKTLRRIFETRAKTAALKTEEIQIRFIRPDVALA